LFKLLFATIENCSRRGDGKYGGMCFFFHLFGFRNDAKLLTGLLIHPKWMVKERKLFYKNKILIYPFFY